MSDKYKMHERGAWKVFIAHNLTGSRTWEVIFRIQKETGAEIQGVRGMRYK